MSPAMRLLGVFMGAFVVAFMVKVLDTTDGSRLHASSPRAYAAEKESESEGRSHNRVSSTTPTIVGGKPYDGPSVIPIVLIAVDVQLSVPRATLPLFCANNDLVIVLATKPQRFKAPCVKEVIVRSNEARWSEADRLILPSNTPSGQRVFFRRWFLLRRWMKESNTTQVFAIDSDAIVYTNITEMVRRGWHHFRKHEIWYVYNPPRSSWPFGLLTLRGLQDITRFWTQMFSPKHNLWQKFVGGTRPNDMISLGHYAHSAVGTPYPCWGYGPTHKAGSCDDTIDYGYTKILNRLRELNVRAKYSPGTLTLDGNGTFEIAEGVVDNNYKSDPIQRYAMHAGKEKRLRFAEGRPEFQRRDSVHWTRMFGYIMEDDLERCVQYHMQHHRKRASCSCTKFCCQHCTPYTIPSIAVVTRWSGAVVVRIATAFIKYYFKYWNAAVVLMRFSADREAGFAAFSSVCRGGVKHVPLRSSGEMRKMGCGMNHTLFLYYNSGDVGGSSGVVPAFTNPFSVATDRVLTVAGDEFVVPAYRDSVTARQQTHIAYRTLHVECGQRNSRPLVWHTARNASFRLKNLLQGDGSPPPPTMEAVVKRVGVAVAYRLLSCAQVSNDTVQDDFLRAFL